MRARAVRPFAGALVLLSSIIFITAIWAGPSVQPAAATVNVLGTDGRYTLLFLGSDKRCRRMHSPRGAERCASIEADFSDPAKLTGTASYPYRWSHRADNYVNVARQKAGSERTDVMTLLTVDPNTGEASAFSIPRDEVGFPLKPSLSAAFCRSGEATFNRAINALYTYAQLCMSRSDIQNWQPKMLGWERSTAAALLVKENFEYALEIEIDDFVVGMFGTADILGAKLDTYTSASATTADDSTLVRLDQTTRFAACKTDTIRDEKPRSYKDHNLASNAKYGNLIFLLPGDVDKKYGGSARVWANCSETSGPNFVGPCSTGTATTRSASGCLFNVPTDLWVGFGRSRKYDSDYVRVLRHQRLIAGITLRVLHAGKPVALGLAALSDMRWYTRPRYKNGEIYRWDAGPPLVRTSIDTSDNAVVGAIFDVVATAQAALTAGPDAASGGWRSMRMFGQNVSVLDGCRIGGAGRFTPKNSTLENRLACTRAWIATEFGPVTP